MGVSERRVADDVVLVNNGRQAARLVRESDPDGLTALHAQVIDSYEHEKLFWSGRISGVLREAGDQYRRLFERAGAGPRYGSTLTASAGGGRRDAFGEADAADKLRRVMAHLGDGGGSDVAWHVIGCGDSIHDYATRRAWKGRHMLVTEARNILIAVLGRLALYFGLTTPANIAADAARQAHTEAVGHAVTVLEALAANARAAGQRAAAKALREAIEAVKASAQPGGR